MNNSARKFLIVVVGPTGIGKTELCINLAIKLNTEIISADSRQFYRELQIGTAAPTIEQLSRVNHHCVGNKSITDYYSIFKFEQDVLGILDNLFTGTRNVILTGGSGLYVDAVCSGVDDIPDIDDDIRLAVLKKFNEEGIEGIRFEIRRLDPEYYNSADLKNPKRLIRALEVCLMTGRPYSSFRTGKIVKRPFEIIWLGLNRERSELYEIINHRVDKMFEEGLLDEARSLEKHKKLNSLNTVGYKELFPYLDGDYSLDKAVELIKRNSRRYAKRQLTWFNKNKLIKWFHPDEINNIIKYIDNIKEKGQG